MSARSLSKRKRGSAEAADEPRPLFVTSKFVQRCRDGVQRGVGENIVIKPVESPRGELLFLRGVQSFTNALDEKVGEIPVTMLGEVPKSTHKIWLAVSIRLTPGRVSILDHASLRLYVGGISAESKRLFVRGEWDFRESRASIAKGHAQPHWHFHLEAQDQKAESPATLVLRLEKLPEPEPAGGIEALRSAITAGVTGTEFPVKRDDIADRKSEKIHFPMGARWHSLPLKCRTDDIDEDAICNWIEGVTRYLRAQCAYLAE